MIILFFKLFFGKIDNLIRLQNQVASHRNGSAEKIGVQVAQNTHICKFLQPRFESRNQASILKQHRSCGFPEK